MDSFLFIQTSDSDNVIFVSLYEPAGWVNPKLETAAVSTFRLETKLETQLPDPKVETSLTVW